jgi:surface antigen
VPVEGDIIHFKPVSGNKYGHVAVVNKATVNMIEVEEQNAKGGQQGL